MQELENVMPTALQEAVQTEQDTFTTTMSPAQDSTKETPPPSPELASSSERNLKALRELKERAERERDEALRKAAELESKFSSAQEDDNFTIGNDELAEGKHLAKVDRRMKKLEEKMLQAQAQATQSLIETRLKMEYPDIESVVNKSNIELLSAQYPHLAATLDSSSDFYNKAVSAYTMIKKLGIVDTMQNETRIAQNTNKPRTISSLNAQQGDSPLSHANAFANGLTRELKEQLWKEMQECMR